MGKPTGFIEYLREMPLDRSPKERVKDWNEFHHHLDEKSLRNQAARCMDCGVPFCMNGCPVNNIIPDFNDLVFRGVDQWGNTKKEARLTVTRAVTAR